jgi:peptide/nickel transport system substrate-binding protein
LAAFESVPFVPLGRYMPQVAWSKRISDPLKGPAPVFWNVSKG